MSSFGKIYKVTTFGESHCNSVGCIVENFPSNFELNLDKIQLMLNRRRPGQSDITTPRNEKDKLILLSGMERNKTLGTPLAFQVKNKDTRPEDYKFDEKSYIPRPSHADFTYIWKYGIHSASGGGRSSARETIGRVIAGACAIQILESKGISIVAFVSQVGKIKLNNIKKNLTTDYVDKFKTRCPDESIDREIYDKILKLKKEGDSIGGKITCIIKNCPKGLGEPVFDKLEALLAHAMLSIPATKGFEIGSGFKCIELTGSEHNDRFIKKENKIITKSNNNGGIIGGISNGNNIEFSVAFKPPATILKKQSTVDLNGNEVILKAKGRHDPCVVPRAVPIVESMAAIVLLDLLMLNNRLKL